jgi:hypothetical protein
VPPSANNANRYINLLQGNFSFSSTGCPDDTGNEGTVISCPVYVSVTSQCCASLKTHVKLYFVVWLYHHLAGKHSDYPSTVALNLARTRTKHMLKDKRY